MPVDDLYDEFNDGIFNPSAVRDFLAYAYTSWQKPAPLYVLLIGDATLDYKNNRWKDTRNFVPSQLLETDLVGQTVSDNWFAAVSGNDILPDLYIGRLSAESLAQVSTIQNKIISYDLGGAASAWNKTLLLVAGDYSARYAGTTEMLIDKSPFYYGAERVYQADYGAISPAPDIIAGFDAGAVLMAYVGHGGVTGWGRSRGRMIFEPDDVLALANGSRLPLVIVANCMSGYFAGSSDFLSMAELFQRQANGGAVAVFAPTDLGYVTGHQALLGALFDGVFQDNLTRVGAATTAAKLEIFAQGGFGPELTESYILFGDPYTRLAIPTNYPYVKGTTPANSATITAVGQPIQIVFSKPVKPESVQVTGPDVAALQLSPTWNDDKTSVTYRHADFAVDKIYQLTVQAQDLNGVPLGAGSAPKSWSFTVQKPAADTQLFLPTIRK